MSTDRSSGRAVALGAGVLILLSSCGAPPSPGTTGQPIGQATGEGADAAADPQGLIHQARADPSAAPTGPIALPARAGRVLSAKQVRAALLSARDLGDGWSQLDVQPLPATRTTPARCARTLATMHAKPPGPQSSRNLAAGRIGPYLSETVTSLPTAALVRLKILTDGLTSCSHYVQILPGIGAFTVTTTPTQALALGDRTAAFRITQSTASTRYVVDYVAVAVGHNLLVLQAGGWSAMASDDLRDLVDKGLAKLGTV